MKYLIVYHLRLSDVIRCFPAALHLHKQGHEVLIECNEEYHGIFKNITYAKPVLPYQQAITKEIPIECCDKLLDLQIWPHKHVEYRKSKLPWMDYVYSRESEIFDAPRQIVFDLVQDSGLEKGSYDLVAPFGISQTTRIDANYVLHRATELFTSGLPRKILNPPGIKISGEGWTPTDCPLHLLPDIIAKANSFIGLNSSPAIIASAVRPEWFQFHDRAYQGQDDYLHDGQTWVD